MTVALHKVVPWGRSLEEYVGMFDLKPTDLQTRILDCAGGPSSFNAQMYKCRHTVVSCDPIYQFDVNEISQRIERTYQAILDATRKSLDNFVWRDIRSPEHLGALRKSAMEQFLQDLPLGTSQGRYLVCELPHLPFRNAEFDLALCSHFLFTYSNILSLEFHLQSIRELSRVATEVRIFPLIGQFGAKHSPYLSEVLTRLLSEGYECQIRHVPYEFQKGGNEMMVVRGGAR